MTTRSTTDLTRYFDEPDANIYINNHHKNLLEDLTIGISRDSQIGIICKWLKGEQRDRIAADLGLGAGTVSAMVSEWKSQIGIPEADALRQFSHGSKIIQIFLKDLEAKIAESNKATEESLRTVKQQSLSISEQTVKSLQTLDAKTKQQLDLFQKIGATAEFTPLVKAARGQYVDLDELKGSVIRAMGIMHSRLNNMLNGGTKNKLQEAIEGLESETLVF